MERIRSAKKIKDGKWFTSPVDPVAMGLPTYFEIIKQPMDLSAMENKLKLNEYGSVNDFVRDFDLMVNNAVKFNGPAHVVSAASLSLRQYFFQPQVQALTRREEPQDAKKPKKPTLATSSKPARRESRSGAAPPKSAGAGSASSPTTFPLHPDGVPLIRRDSAANDRPKREIHRPPPRDLPYSHRPKKKKFSLELKFCETVQDEILKNKYKTIAWPFYDPVDPVALNIPTYHKVIKKPMDLSTISKNLKEGHYENAKSYYNDVKLMFDNCYKFNPETDEVNRVGKLFQKTFEEIWAGKQTWMDEHAPQSDPQSPASAAASDSEQEEEEDEIDPETEAQQRLIAIQQQIAALSGEANQIITQTLPGAKRASPKVGSKKNKGAKPNTKSKRSSNVGLPSSKASTKPKKKLPPITFAQKQEISDAIASLGDVEMGKAVQIIRNGVPSLKDVNDDEMELDIETIPDSVLHELLKFTRQHKPPKEDIPQDDEYEPPRAKTATSRPKKNKPMSKYEQEAAINNIQAQLGKFQHGVSGSISPTNE
ncbi:Bromodomain-containing protein [Patellaria atrata CBS 101060]|uniref:Bromodomain-containing protein n=1 Tax=Patellaria atrata CBS 101060 TaxID=1346257 RepID=A0A9P4VTF2_9PEZI|nr:Bromodomain-containing protein [Patellaria atrata CBS 101060]